MAAAVQMNSTKPSPDPNRTWLGQKAKPTQAKRKHTLTGASLEIFKNNELDEISKIDTKQVQLEIDAQRRLKQDRYKRTLPEHLKSKTAPESEQYEKSKEELIKQMGQTARAQQTMDALEMNSKYFSVGLYDSNSKPSSPDKKPGWYGKADLQHSSDINIVGLPDPANYTSSYNRDKYGRRGTTHLYSVIGDPLKMGMDFNTKSASDSDAKRAQSYHRARNPDWLPREAYRQQNQPDNTTLAIDLPPNIQHAFGSKICRSVLGDKAKVDSTLNDQKRLRDSFYRKRGDEDMKFKLPKEEIDPAYEGLSNAVRQNMFPGHTFNHKTTVHKTVFSQDVHDKRLKDPDKYRYQRDELSTWAEQNVLRERVKKAWDSYKAEASG